ncbi:MAG: HAMP domain-containing histidine kinase, partial [Gemmataceae bacterium]|nr:HAMP domain-containing histidine kinase [Gemmataceae bacterium]
ARLETSFQEMRRFTADASHELRTPLAAIRTEAEVALSKPLDLAECRQLLESILEECSRLNRLTDQLLALAREDIGVNPEMASLDLKPIVEKVVETMQPVAGSRNQSIQVDLREALPVQGDGNRLRQLLYNLLDNAIKYTPAGGLITVTGNQNRGCVRVTIRDTGMGIAKNDLPRVFDRFYRVDKSRNREGTGLGLSIARGIIVAHSGTIEIESEIGRGTLATIEIPSKQS